MNFRSVPLTNAHLVARRQLRPSTIIHITSRTAELLSVPLPRQTHAVYSVPFFSVAGVGSTAFYLGDFGLGFPFQVLVWSMGRRRE